MPNFSSVSADECSSHSLSTTSRSLCLSMSHGKEPFDSFINIKVLYIIEIFTVVPINILSLYLIMFHSRTSLKQLKFLLLCHQTATTILNFYLAELVQPVLYPPLVMLETPGPLYKLLGVQPFTAMTITFFLFSSLPPITIHLFVYKQQLLLPPVSRWKLPEWMFKTTFAIFLPFSMFGTAFVFYFIASGDVNKSKTLMTYPFLSSIISHERMLVLNWENDIYLQIWGIACLLGTSTQAFLVTSIAISCYYLIHSRVSYSAKTKRMEFQLLLALFLQVAIQWLSITLPVAYCAVIVYFELWFVQDITNIATITCTSYAFFSSVLLIGLNKPYREAAMGLFRSHSSNNDLPVGSVPSRSLGSRSISGQQVGTRRKGPVYHIGIRQ